MTCERMLFNVCLYWFEIIQSLKGHLLYIERFHAVAALMPEDH